MLDKLKSRQLELIQQLESGEGIENNEQHETIESLIAAYSLTISELE